MELVAQVGVSLLLVSLCVVVHALGLMLTSRLFRLEDEELQRRSLDARSFFLIPTIGLALFAAHALEVLIFAGFFLLTGVERELGAALVVSASSYTTAGNGPYNLSAWELVAQAEALMGLLLIGWSTAYLVSRLEKLRE